MKTQKIKVEIEAEVPVGEYCISHNDNIRCDNISTVYRYGKCSSFPDSKIKTVEVEGDTFLA